MLDAVRVSRTKAAQLRAWRSPLWLRPLLDERCFRSSVLRGLVLSVGCDGAVEDDVSSLADHTSEPEDGEQTSVSDAAVRQPDAGGAPEPTRGLDTAPEAPSAAAPDADSPSGGSQANG